MRDGPLRTLVRLLVRWVRAADLGLRRGLTRPFRKPTWELTGACQACARCCEAPTVQVGPAAFYLGPLRRLYLSWQRVINGFDLIEADAEALCLVFRCTHFDWDSRRCDSYHSRPAMCRDYPRPLLDHAWPAFEGCGFRVLAADRARQLAVLDEQDLPPDTLDELKGRLRLE